MLFKKTISGSGELMKKSIIFKIGIIFGMIGIYTSLEPVQRNIKQSLFIMENLDSGLLEGYIGSFGSFSTVASLLLMIFQSVLAYLPRAVLILSNANIFGVANGVLISWLGSLAGASICFLIAKIYGRKTVEKLILRFKLEKIDKLLGGRGMYIVFILRLFPFMPFDIISYMMGLTSISFRSFVVGTGIGQLPLIIIYSYFGETFSGSVKMTVFGILSALAASVAIFLSRNILDKSSLKEISKKGDEEIA